MTRLGAMIRGFKPGMAAGVAGFAGGSRAEQEGYDAGVARETKIAQALAQIRAQDANADKDAASAEQTRAQTGLLAARPDLFEEQAALYAGVDLPTLRAVRQSVATGQAPQRELYGPATPEGGQLMGTLDIAPEVKNRIGQALMRMLPIRANAGDINPQQFANAMGAYREMDLGDDVLAGRRTPGAVGASQAAVAGKPMFSSDSTGAVLDLFGGKLATDNPMAQSAIALRGAQAGAQKANAAQSYAQAGAANALRDQRKAEMSDSAKAPTGYRWKADGTMEFVPGGPADPAVKGSNTRTGPMSAALQKELLEADDAVQAAAGVVRALETALKQNSTAYSGYLAKQRATLRSNLPGESAAADATIDIDNLMTGQGLESLKAIFGAAPTEGERKILMDMQASVDKTPGQRRAIIDRAIAAAKRRADYAARKATSIRDGSYLSSGIEAPAQTENPPSGFRYIGRE